MTLFFVLAIALASADSAKEEADCAIVTCSAARLRDLWLAERSLRIDWETRAAELDRKLLSAAQDLAAKDRLLDRERTARLTQAAPAPVESNTSCLWISAGVCGLCGGVAVGATAAVLTR